MTKFTTKKKKKINDKSFIKYIFCKYFPLVFGLPMYCQNHVFHTAEVFILMKCNIILFIDHALGVVSKKSLPNQGYLDFFLCYLLKVLYFSVLYLELWYILSQFLGRVKRLCLDFFFSHEDTQLFQQYLLKRLSFSHWIIFASLTKINWLYLCWFVSEFSILSLICLFFISTI